MANTIYEFNRGYFKEINTEAKAYILGFIYADGNIDTNNNQPNRLRLTLKASDRDILEKIASELNYSGQIVEKYTTSHGNPYKICNLNLNSVELVTDLIHLGVTPNKTFKIDFPSYNQVPKHLIRHFIRGYFDGDGSIYHLNNLSRKSDIRIGLVSGSKEFLYKLIDELSLELSITKAGVRNRKRDLQFTKSGNQAFTILDYMYDKSNIYLDRKYSLYIQYKNMLKDGVLKCRE